MVIFFLVICLLGKKDFFFVVRPDFIVSFTFIIYSIPICLNALVGDNRYDISESNLLIITLTTLLFLVSFSIGFNFRTEFQSISFIDKKMIKSDFPISFSYAILVFGIILFLINANRFGGFWALVLLSRGELMDVGNGVLSIGTLMIKVGLLFIFFNIYFKENHKNGGMLYSKPFLFLLLFLYIFSNFVLGERRIMAGLRARQFLIPVFLLVFLAHFFSKVRHLNAEPLLMLESMFTQFQLDWFDISEGEVGAHYFVFNDILEKPENFNYMLGSSYLKSIYLLIPNIGVTRDYNGLADWFVRTYHRDIWTQGGGYGFSFIAETYINFWFFGPIIIGLFMGFIFASLWIFCVIEFKSIFSLAIYSLSLSIMMTMPRTDFSYVLKEFYLLVLFPLFFYFIIILFNRTFLQESQRNI